MTGDQCVSVLRQRSGASPNSRAAELPPAMTVEIVGLGSGLFPPPSSPLSELLEIHTDVFIFGEDVDRIQPI